MSDLEPILDNRLILSPSQQIIQRELQDSIRKEIPGKRLIVISGLTGVGKTTVIGNIKDEIALRGFKLSDSILDTREALLDQMQRADGGLILPINPSEETAIQQLAGGADMIFERHILPAMSSDEMRQYLKSTNQTASVLPLETVIQYSLGVPVLAQRLIQNATTTSEAITYAAEYLVSSLPNDIDPQNIRQYFQMNIPESVTEQSRKMKDKSKLLSDLLVKAKEKFDEIVENNPTVVIPRPVSPETLAIYRDTLINTRQSNQLGGYRRVEIIAHNIPSDILEHIQRNFGFANDTYIFVGSPLQSMFRSSNDRFSIIDYSDTAYHMHKGNRGDINRREIAELSSRASKFGLRTGDGSNFYMQYFDHPTGPESAATAGLMTESLLQQLGVPYYVQNTYLGTEYLHDPNSHNIVYPIENQLKSLKSTLENVGITGFIDALVSQGYKREQIDVYIKDNPQVRELMLGLPSHADLNLSSLRPHLERLTKVSSDPMIQRISDRLTETLEGLETWYRGDSPFPFDLYQGSFFDTYNVKALLSYLQKIVLEQLRSEMYDETKTAKQRTFNKALDLATDYMVIKRLLSQIPEI